MPTWPASLPQSPLVRGFQERWGDTRLRTQMDVGEPKMRRRATKAIDSFPVVFRLTAAQRTTLRSFWDSDLAGGSLRFDWTHPIDGTTEQFRFVTPPRLGPVARGGLYDASFELEKVS